MKKNRLFLIFFLGLAFSHPLQAKDAFEVYGDVGQIAIPVGAGVVSLFKKDRAGGKQLLFGYVGTIGLTYSLKAIFNTTDLGRRPGSHSAGESFPSGHTASAFAGAAYLHHRYGYKMGLPALSAATAVGLSRIHAKKHHARDVVVGALLAYGVSFFVTDRFQDSVTLLPWLEVKKPNFGIIARIHF